MMTTRTTKTNKPIIKDNLKHCIKVNGVLNCKNFGDYHMTHFNCEVLLLADVFESIRKTCITYYDVDPSTALTTPY